MAKPFIDHGAKSRTTTVIAIRPAGPNVVAPAFQRDIGRSSLGCTK
jgi:hypothetical protein